MFASGGVKALLDECAEPFDDVRPLGAHDVVDAVLGHVLNDRAFRERSQNISAISFEIARRAVLSEEEVLPKIFHAIMDRDLSSKKCQIPPTPPAPTARCAGVCLDEEEFGLGGALGPEDGARFGFRGRGYL